MGFDIHTTPVSRFSKPLRFMIQKEGRNMSLVFASFFSSQRHSGTSFVVGTCARGLRSPRRGKIGQKGGASGMGNEVRKAPALNNTRTLSSLPFTRSFRSLVGRSFVFTACLSF